MFLMFSSGYDYERDPFSARRQPFKPQSSDKNADNPVQNKKAKGFINVKRHRKNRRGG
jgi:hypothetical protein